MATVMTVHLIETPVHGRYLHLARDPRRLLVGFHGYAETADAHLAQIEQVPGIGEWSVAAVQALHPFYTRSQEVVASWMTKLDREEAIADNIEYVRRVVAALPPAGTLVFAGFSQGVAMAYRAAAAIRCSGVIAIGGDLPPDVEPANLPRAFIGRGIRDDWFSDEKLKKDLNSLPNASVCAYDGGHEWTAELRAAVGEFLAGMTGQDVD